MGFKKGVQGGYSPPARWSGPTPPKKNNQILPSGTLLRIFQHINLAPNSLPGPSSANKRCKLPRRQLKIIGEWKGGDIG